MSMDTDRWIYPYVCYVMLCYVMLCFVMYVFIYTHTSYILDTYIVYIYTFIFAYIYTYLHMYLHVYIYTYVYIYVYTHICSYIYIHSIIHTFIYIYTHAIISISKVGYGDQVQGCRTKWRTGRLDLTMVVTGMVLGKWSKLEIGLGLAIHRITADSKNLNVSVPMGVDQPKVIKLPNNQKWLSQPKLHTPWEIPIFKLESCLPTPYYFCSVYVS
jgi:hypothetical protein